uniref:Peptidase S1 domain-containing protein n=1 Tax=Anopheles dirus TaxID=7168 RepID=A0A182MYZ7_9DIPT
MCLSPTVALIVALTTINLPLVRPNRTAEDENEYGNMVVGGFKVDIEVVPFQVALFEKGELICGGTIIGPRWVLTSYHCVDSLDPTLYQIVVGTDKPREGHKHQVQNIFLHPKIETNQQYDMALLKLAEPLQFSKKVNCVELLSSQEPLVVGTPVYISGFGSTAEYAFDSPLKAATIDLLPWETCDDTYADLMQDFMLCAGFERGKVDTCQGDSGGPLLLDGMLAGITYYGRGCARPGSPGVYISVAHFAQLIKDTVNSEPNPDDRKLCQKTIRDLV